MQIRVTWFRHNHENRNDLLRFGFMRLYYSGVLQYTERPFSEIEKYGFSRRISLYPDPRHLSFLLIEEGHRKVRCLVDNEDSFALITPLIAEVDICFCAGYNSDFFVRKQFIEPYSWQARQNLHWYQKTLADKIDKLGHHFDKIQKFIPIAPNQGAPVAIGPLKRKYKNLIHRLNRIVGKGNDFSDVYKGFEIREAYLDGMRTMELEYDIVLNDSLWGWPQHRINLHNRLLEMNRAGKNIYSILKYTPPVEHDGSIYTTLDPASFPIITKQMHQSYEVMLAKSRLAVFACGFHWGWRNIMMYALRTGIPVLTDRLLTEAYFDFSEFILFQKEDHHWNCILPVLEQINESEWKVFKKQNQEVYDKYMSPEKVASYLIQTIKLN